MRGSSGESPWTTFGTLVTRTAQSGTAFLTSPVNAEANANSSRTASNKRKAIKRLYAWFAISVLLSFFEEVSYYINVDGLQLFLIFYTVCQYLIKAIVIGFELKMDTEYLTEEIPHYIAPRAPRAPMNSRATTWNTAHTSPAFASTASIDSHATIVMASGALLTDSSATDDRAIAPAQRQDKEADIGLSRRSTFPSGPASGWRSVAPFRIIKHRSFEMHRFEYYIRLMRYPVFKWSFDRVEKDVRILIVAPCKGNEDQVLESRKSEDCDRPDPIHPSLVRMMAE